MDLNTQSEAMDTYVFNFPKIELHAHLNGSLSKRNLVELAGYLFDTNTVEYDNILKRIAQLSIDSLNSAFNQFVLIHELTSTKKGLELATLFVIRDFIYDNVVHLELRTTPKHTENMTKLEYLQTVIIAILKSRESNRSISIQVLPSIDRRGTLESAAETIELAIYMHQHYPNIVTGIDLSGHPEFGNFEQYKPLLVKARQNGLKLAIHCGEIPNAIEVNSMLEFGMDRCGHGTCLDDDQLKQCGLKRICIECCLTSNVKCKTVTSYRDHHFGKILAANVIPVVLCTDDSGVFAITQTYELLMAVRTFNLTKEHIYKLAHTAVDYAFTNNLTKKKLRSIVDTYYKNN